MSGKMSKSKWNDTNLFWAGFVLVLLMLVGMTIYAQNKNPISKQEPRKPRKPDIVIDWKKFKKHFPKINADLTDTFRKAQKEMDAKIENRIDETFKPVYGQIPKLANFHYSVKGEYTEIVATLSGSLAKDLAKILFDDIQFKEKLKDAGSKITGDSQSILRSALDEFRTNIKNKMKLNEAGMSYLANHLSFSVKNVEQRLNLPITAVQRGALAATGEVVGVAAKGISVLAKKFAAKTAAKVVAKGGVKYLSAGSGALAGAVICSPGGLVAFVCGAFGAVAAWVIVDAVVIKVDEYINREDFEKDIRSMIDEQKSDVKKAFKDRYVAYIKKAKKSNADRLKRLPEGKTPAEMVGYRN